eukprot:1490087-Pyramimonas_sp.AAC.1
MFHRVGGPVRATGEVSDAALRLQTLLESVDLKIAASKPRAMSNVPAARLSLEKRLRRPPGMQSVGAERNLGVDFALWQALSKESQDRKAGGCWASYSTGYAPRRRQR